MKQRPYEKLIVWKEAHSLCLLIYLLTKTFPPDEKFGLVSQMRRSSSSVPTNIAEGNGRRTNGDKMRFIDISAGSLEELHYQSILSRDLAYISTEQYVDIDDRIQRTGYLLHQFHKSFE